MNNKEELKQLNDLNKKLFALVEVNKSVTKLNELSESLKEVFAGIEKGLGYRSSLLLANEETKTLSAYNISKFTQTLVETFLGKDSFEVPLEYSNENEMGLAVRAFKTGEVQYSNSMYEIVKPLIGKRVADSIQGVIRVKYGIVVPIKLGKEVIAVLTAGSRNPITDQDEDILIRFAENAGLAIYNSRLYSQSKTQIHQLEQQNKDLSSLFNLTSQISRSLDPVRVAQIAANALPQDDQMVGAIITSYSKLSNTITVRAVTQNKLSQNVKKLIGDFDKYTVDLSDVDVRTAPLGKAVIQEKPMFTNDLVSVLHPPIPKRFIKPIETILKIKSIAIYPVITRGELKGTVSFLIKDRNAEEFEDKQKQLLQTYTSQIGIALENAQLFTASQRIQASLEKALDELKEAREKERDMIDIMGHELRTPMSIVRNSLGMMEMHLKQNGEIPVKKQQKYVDTALESAKREITLIETLLSATKADAKGFDLTFEKIDFTDVVNDAVEGFKKQAEKKGLDFTVDVPEEIVYVYADRTRVQEVADNFMGNAVKYTPKGSVHISLEVKDGYAWIHMKDSGFGISEPDLKRLGHKFFRARQHIGEKDSSAEIEKTEVPSELKAPSDEKTASVIRPGGTGLGLYVSFSLVYIMNGKLKIESTLGEGSTFSFAMPLYTDQKLRQDQLQVDGNNLPIKIKGNKLTIN